MKKKKRQWDFRTAAHEHLYHVRWSVSWIKKRNIKRKLTLGGRANERSCGPRECDKDREREHAL